MEDLLWALGLIKGTEKTALFDYKGTYLWF